MSAATLQSGGDEGITDNESSFESASYYLGRNRHLHDADMADIDDHDEVNEIPVWVRGEARWIAGVTEHTTASDLVEALLLDDRSLIDSATASRAAGDHHHQQHNRPPPSSSVLQQYVITERWRQMEQVLEPSSRVWKIWNAWGEAQCEVGGEFPFDSVSFACVQQRSRLIKIAVESLGQVIGTQKRSHPSNFLRGFRTVANGGEMVY